MNSEDLQKVIVESISRRIDLLKRNQRTQEPNWNVTIERDLYIPVKIRAVIDGHTYPQTWETPAEEPSLDCWEAKIGDLDISDALPQDTVKEVYEHIWNHDVK